ncbi:right-handed parallel beta-helix repeat-containing protein [Haloferax profundi]|uniref:right-handed parallel beta-helix repeat-containing protein n=1 Tax=Haloferax profundi TaxID=1544718 RepID=UPI000B05F6CF|nr:right-handed parallel beta-helix repeat-containing protein [Haloferax profundi]
MVPESNGVQKEDDDSLLGRRTYLKLGGATLAALALGTGSASAESHPYTLIVDGSDTSESTEYVFEVSETIQKISSTSTDSSSDTVSDGRVEGSVTDGVDAYEFSGNITSFSFDGPAVVKCGENIEQTVEHTIEIISTEDPSELTYEFTATDEITKIFNDTRNSAETRNDQISQNSDGTWTAQGYTGNGYGDSFKFKGELVEFSPNTGPFKLLIDGQEVDPSEFGSQTSEPTDDSTPTGPAIGGGDGYPNTVAPSEADYLVSSTRELVSAFDDASSGDVVYVEGGAEIDVGRRELTVPRGITLASDRGINGAEGGLIKTDHSPWAMLEVQDDVRITGLQVGGPRWDWVEADDTELGIDARGSNIEIDNVNAFGWGYAAIRSNDDTHIHHCHLHHNPREGHGYGVATEGSDNPIIEYNLFDHNRHSVQGNGGGYTIRYNHVKADAISHVFDQHRPGGTTMKIYNNTVEAIYDELEDEKVPAVAIRGVPDDIADIHDNWFYNPVEPRDNPSGWTNEAIIQVHTDEWRNVSFNNNHYGSSEPSSDIGCPR